MSWTKAAEWLHQKSGSSSVVHSTVDVHLLLASRFLRQFAFGSTAIIFVPFFSSLGHSDTRIGVFMTLTLLGDGAISLVLTGMADVWGRRRILILAAAGMIMAGIIFALINNYWVLLVAAIVGVVSPRYV